MLGGPFMNLLIYLVLTVFLLTVIGSGTTTPRRPSAASRSASSRRTRTGGQQHDLPGRRARRAPADGVLQPGDKLVAINGTTVTSWDHAVAVIEESAGKPLADHRRRATASTRRVTLTPVENVKYANAEGTKTKTAGFIGVAPTHRTPYFDARVGDRRCRARSAARSSRPSAALGQLPGQDPQPLADGLRGQAARPQRRGRRGRPRRDRRPGRRPTTSTSSDKIYSLIGLLASVNLLLFFFNLLPLLPLDGGHVAGALVEAVKRGRARLRARNCGRPTDGDR